MIELKNISKSYQMGSITVQALQDVSLRIDPGEFVAIMGPSGSGKSTLLHILGFLDSPDSGSYAVFGENVANLKDDKLAILRNNLAGFVFQQFYLLPRMKAIENVELPLIYAGKKSLKDQAKEKLKEVDLSDRASHKPSELSGGQQQRVAIARALVNEPMVIFADEPTGNLDTKSKEEIMAILEDLNKKGKTIVMVTHERDIALRTRRIINVLDGRIISDERLKKEPVKNYSVPYKNAEEMFSRKSLNFGKALLVDHIPQAVKSMLSHKMRSILSMLGILIGVSSVIAMLALGKGAEESISKRLASLGSNLLTVMPGSQRMGGISLEAGSVTRFTIEDAAAISNLSGVVRRVSPSVRGRAQIIYGGKNWSTSVQGVGVDYPDMHASQLTFGRFFTEDELKKREKLAVIGMTIVREVYGDKDPVGTVLKINRIYFTVIGVLPQKGATGWRDEDDVVLVPVTTAMFRLLGKKYVDSIDVEIKDISLMDSAQKMIKEEIIRKHELAKEDQDSFQIRNMADIQETLKSTVRTMTMLLGSIAAISLLVGGIGIMNIMLVSVTERTREIGLRKAIGAQGKDIMLQFLIESIIMTFSGGLIGVIFGAAIAMLMSAIAGWTVVVTLFSVVLSTTFSVIIGMSFGIFPARKASKLDPIEALRFE